MTPILDEIGIAGERLLGIESNHGVDVHLEPEAKPALSDAPIDRLLLGRGLLLKNPFIPVKISKLPISKSSLLTGNGIIRLSFSQRRFFVPASERGRGRCGL